MRRKLIEKKREEYPAKDTLIALTFECEIKRVAIEKGIEIADVIARLSENTGVCQRHIYNYRAGKTDIPVLLIPKFCKQFGSNVLAMAVMTMCDEAEFEQGDLFDLSRFVSKSVQNVLKSGDEFLEAFDDGTINGFEFSKLSLSTARIIRDANRMLELAASALNRRMAA